MRIPRRLPLPRTRTQFKGKVVVQINNPAVLLERWKSCHYVPVLL